MGLPKKVFITAGPTYEPIDPVRFIGNRSSGKMGVALANAFLNEGYIVVMALGPVSIQVPQHPNLTVHRVETAAQMYQVFCDYISWYDIAVFAAAVADYTPAHPAAEKIKKKEDTFSIALTKTKDILAEAGKNKKEHQLLVGFALETNNSVDYAKEKLIKKNADIIILNTLEDQGAGFKHDTNKISILDKRDNLIKFEVKSKEEVALDILEFIKSEWL